MLVILDRILSLLDQIRIRLSHQLMIITQPLAKVLSTQTAYQILGVKPGASKMEIRRAYKQHLLRTHPDKHGQRSLSDFLQVQKAYETLANISTLNEDRIAPFFGFVNLTGSSPLGISFFHSIRAPQFKNARTFVELIPIEDVAFDDRIVLDNYVFSIKELIQYGQHQLLSFYKNPHLTQSTQNQDFSEQAQRQMHQHEQLAPFACELDRRLKEQAKVIQVATIDAVITMLAAFEREGVVGSSPAQGKFLEHVATLSKYARAALNDYIISVALTGGGYQRLRFEDALNGGAVNEPCINTANIYLWQFVVDHRATCQIPHAVHMQARAMHLAIRSRQPSPPFAFFTGYGYPVLYQLSGQTPTIFNPNILNLIESIQEQQQAEGSSHQPQ